MAPTSSKSLAKKTPTRKRSVMSIADKIKILNAIDAGETIATIARRFSVNESTVRTIRDNREKIRSTSVTLGKHASSVKVVRNEVLEKMEEMLMIWMQDLIHKRIPMSTAAIRTKAVSFYDYLNNLKYEKNEKFNASKGWFEKFKSRYSLHSLKFTGKIH